MSYGSNVPLTGAQAPPREGILHTTFPLDLGPFGERVLSATIARGSQAFRASGSAEIMLVILAKVGRGLGGKRRPERLCVSVSNAAEPDLQTVLIRHIFFEFAPPHVPQCFSIVPQWVWNHVVMKVHCRVQPPKDLRARSGFQALGVSAGAGITFLINEATGPGRWANGEEIVQPPFEGALRCNREPPQSAIQNDVDESLEIILELVNIVLHPHGVEGHEIRCPLSSCQR